MSDREITVRIHDENLSEPLEYEISGPSQDSTLESRAMDEVHFIRDRVGRWHDFTGDGVALLNSAHTIELELTWWVMRKGNTVRCPVTHSYVITEDETPESVFFGE